MVLSAGLLGLLTGFILGLEWAFPRSMSRDRANLRESQSVRWFMNLGFYFIGLGSYRLLAPVLYALWGITHSKSDWLLHSPVKLVMGILTMDFVAFFVHRLHHKWKVLWLLHRLHHSDSRLDVATSFRANPFQWFTIGLLELGLAIVFQVPFEAVFLHGMVLPFFLVWHHAAVDLPDGIESCVNRILVTPGWHEIHHRFGNQRNNQHFGAIFSIWDRIWKRFEGGLRVPSFLTLAPMVAILPLLSCTEKPRSIEIAPAMQAEIDYGKDLIQHTARYLGPKGSVSKSASRMACQNCHLNAGEKPYGISLKAVHTRYPSYRAREGKVLSAADRINNCIECPLNGKPLALDSREMRSIEAYFFSLAQGRAVGQVVAGDQLNDVLRFPSRAADPAKGAGLFKVHCIKCHGENGQGQLTVDQNEFIYPPLWGPESFCAGSNMNRITKMATFIRMNMPLGSTFESPTFNDEDAFDLAAFVLDDRLHPRPRAKYRGFPTLSEKPIDYAEGPFVDGKSETEHRLGPFVPIIENLRRLNQPVYF